jgi:hypothetical protein
MAVAEFVGLTPLLEQFLHQAQRHPKALGDLLPRALLCIVGLHDSFPQIQRQGLHPAGMHLSQPYGYSFI